MLQITPSSRLNFVLMSMQDADLLHLVDQDEEVMRYLNGGKRSSMQQIQDVMMPRMALYRDEQTGFGIWQVRRSEDNCYLGWVLIRPMHFNTDSPSKDDAEIGWRFMRPYWGQGYASEAAKAIACAVFQHNPQLRFLSATATPDNAGSIAVMKKLGMDYVKHYVHRDSFGELDAVLYRRSAQGLILR